MNPAENAWPPPSQMEEVPSPPSAPAASAEPARSLDVKNPLLAAFLSLFPGVGHVYDGLYLRGLTFFLIIASLITLVDRNGAPIFGMGIAFFWLLNVIDAYRQAVLINHGYAQDLGLLDQPKVPRPGQGGLAAGIILTLIGTISLLDRYVIIDLDWLLDLWPIALILIGVWLIWGYVREKSRAQSA